MGRFDGYLLCSDIDGTLTVDGELPEENAAAVRYFQQEGGLFTLSTGRYPHYVRRFAPRLVPNAPVIGANGTMLYDLATDRVLYRRQMGAEVWGVIGYVERHCPEVSCLYIGQDESGEFDHRRQENGRFAIPETLTLPWHKVVICCQTAEGTIALRDALQAQFGDTMDFERSLDSGIEVHTKGGGKGSAVEELRRLCPAVHTVVAVGDYENDITMLRTAHIGYAVGNAFDAVKAAANRVTVSNRECAIARIIADLEQA